jgi:hypothetical protein
MSRIATVLAALLIAAPSTAQEQHAEKPLETPGPPGDGPRLQFIMTKVCENQHPDKAPPYHAAGGEWTYAEAQLEADPAATFIFGVPGLAMAPGKLFGFKKMFFIQTTPRAGAAVVAAFAKEFSVPLPAAQKPKPGPHEVSLTIHGRLRKRSHTGIWTAAKLTCGPEDAEVFFNFSFTEKKGEFAEKDVDYNRDVATCLAAMLRDLKP